MQIGRFTRGGTAGTAGSEAADRYALLLVGLAAVLHLFGYVLPAGAFPPTSLAEWLSFLVTTSAAAPLIALAYWVLVSRWEAARGIREHRGAAALLVGLAVLFTLLSLNSTSFSLYFAVFLFLMGVRTRTDRLPGYGFLAAVVSVLAGAGWLPIPPAILVGVYAATCFVGAFARARITSSHAPVT